MCTQGHPEVWSKALEEEDFLYYRKWQELTKTATMHLFWTGGVIRVNSNENHRYAEAPPVDSFIICLSALTDRLKKWGYIKCVSLVGGNFCPCDTMKASTSFLVKLFPHWCRSQFCSFATNTGEMLLLLVLLVNRYWFIMCLIFPFSVLQMECFSGSLTWMLCCTTRLLSLYRPSI